MGFVQRPSTGTSYRIDGVIWLSLVVVLLASGTLAFLQRGQSPRAEPRVFPVELTVPEVGPAAEKPTLDPVPVAPAANPLPETKQPQDTAVESGPPVVREAPRPKLDLRLPAKPSVSGGAAESPYGPTLNNSDMRPLRIDPRMTPMPEAPPVNEPYVNTYGELERRISRDCALRQYVQRLQTGNDELVAYIASCQKRGDPKLKRDFDAMAERRRREPLR